MAAKCRVRCNTTGRIEKRRRKEWKRRRRMMRTIEVDGGRWWWRGPLVGPSSTGALSGHSALLFSVFLFSLPFHLAAAPRSFLSLSHRPSDPWFLRSSFVSHRRHSRFCRRPLPTAKQISCPLRSLVLTNANRKRVTGTRVHGSSMLLIFFESKKRFNDFKRDVLLCPRRICKLKMTHALFSLLLFTRFIFCQDFSDESCCFCCICSLYR